MFKRGSYCKVCMYVCVCVCVASLCVCVLKRTVLRGRGLGRQGRLGNVTVQGKIKNSREHVDSVPGLSPCMYGFGARC